MPDLRPVYDELLRRLSVHQDVFEPTFNATDAKAAGGRRVDAPSPDSHVLLGAPDERYPGGVSFAGFSCTRVDEALFGELADLTARDRQQYADPGLLRRAETV